MSAARGKPVPAGCCASWVGRGVCPRRASLATSTGKQQHQIHNVGTCLPNRNQFFLIQFISSWNQIFLGSYGLLTWGKMKYLFHIWSSSFQWAEDKSHVYCWCVAHCGDKRTGMLKKGTDCCLLRLFVYVLNFFQYNYRWSSKMLLKFLDPWESRYHTCLFTHPCLREVV